MSTKTITLTVTLEFDEDMTRPSQQNQVVENVLHAIVGAVDANEANIAPEGLCTQRVSVSGGNLTASQVIGFIKGE